MTPLEIERKFLVGSRDWQPESSSLLRQGYLNRDPERTVRVRVSDEEGWLTIKGITKGATRAQFEYPIPRKEAEALLSLCEPPLLEKTRHRVPHAGRIWEVDEFHGDNDGLIVAEIELASEDEAVELPAWVGEEVTSDTRYYNSSLAAHPYKGWGGHRTA